MSAPDLTREDWAVIHDALLEAVAEADTQRVMWIGRSREQVWRDRVAEARAVLDKVRPYTEARPPKLERP